VSIAEIITQSNHAFSARELAKLLGVHKLTIYRNVTAGRLKSFFVGASLRFEPKAVAAWLNMRGAMKMRVSKYHKKWLIHRGGCRAIWLTRSKK
jgi:excisionase family DNA binding protein